MNANSNFPIDESLQQFLESLPEEIPLQAAHMASSSSACIGQRLSELIASSNHPTGAMTTALLWLRIALIDPAHDIVQSSSAPLASYLHGVVHRLEGDFWNSLEFKVLVPAGKR